MKTLKLNTRANAPVACAMLKEMEEIKQLKGFCSVRLDNVCRWIRDNHKDHDFNGWITSTRWYEVEFCGRIYNLCVNLPSERANTYIGIEVSLPQQWTCKPAGGAMNFAPPTGRRFTDRLINGD